MKKPNELKIELIPIDDIKPDPKNERLHPEENIMMLAKGLEQFDQQKPIVIDANNQIIAGHGVYLAAKASGYTHWNCVRSSLKGRKQRAFRVFDNKSGELSKWDDEALGQTLYELHSDGYAIADIGFDLADYDWDKKDKNLNDEKEDEIPEIADNEFGVQLGDVWQLGDHRLMCGDSTNEYDVNKLMDGNQTSITFTSPPYNIGKTIRGNLYKNDNDNKKNYVKFLNDFTNISLQSSMFVFVNLQLLSGNWFDILEYQSNFMMKIKDIFIWNKKICPPNIQKGSFNTKFEMIYCFTNEIIKGRNFPCSWQGKYSNVIETESNSNNEFAKEHKAGFPIAFPLWFIEKMDFIKSIYEPFCGTGTTLIACEKTNRKCYGMELDPHYCSVIIKRWQDYTNKEAKKL